MGSHRAPARLSPAARACGDGSPFIIALGSVYECPAILDILRLRRIAPLFRYINARNYAVRIAQMLVRLAR